MFLVPDWMPRWAVPLLIVAVVSGTGACVDLTRPSLRDGGADTGLGDTLHGERDGGDPDGLPPDGDLGNGKSCSVAAECASGLCIDDVCCDSACAGRCTACNVAGKEGSCAAVPAGEDPAQECDLEPIASCGQDGTCDGAGSCRKVAEGSACKPGECSAGTETPASRCEAGSCRASSPRSCPGGVACLGEACAIPCSADGGCPTGSFCDVDVCRAKLAPGLSCSRVAQCASGHCVDNVCCSTACTELCVACNNPDSLGTCARVAAGQDPRQICAVDTGNSCGTDGTCNGAGACRRPTNTACGATSCTGGIETPQGRCNGAGTCAPIAPRDCGAYACAGTRCATGCFNDSHCAPGYTCSGLTCVALPGPVLYWKLDEVSGTTAFDATTNGLHGSYTGNAGAIPASSSDMPAQIGFPNAASRTLLRAQRHAILLANVPASLKPTADVTMSVWYKAASTDTTGDSEILSASDNWNLRVMNNEIEVSKNISSGHRQCYFATTKATDNNWHHLAGVITMAEMRLYFDGVLGATCALTGAIAYLSSTVNLWVGRHGSGTSDVRDFEGNLDDVRVYTRALSAAEIARLAAGRP